MVDAYQCLWSGSSRSCLWFLVFCIQIAPEPFALFHHIVLIIYDSLWCFTDDVKDPYVDRTYICNLNLHQNYPLKRGTRQLSFLRGMPTLKPVILTIHRMQPFRASALIQERTHIYTNIQHTSLHEKFRCWILPTLIYRISIFQKYQHLLRQFCHYFLDTPIHKWEQQ